MSEWWRIQIGDEDGDQNIHFAAACGNYHQLFTNLNVGCEINAQNNFGWTPLMQAARNGQAACVKLLLNFGADVTIQNRFGICALSLAAASGSLETVSLLIKNYIQKGIPLEHIEKYFSPVFFAVLCNNIEILRYLEKYKYSLTKIVPLGGFSPIAVAKILKHKEILGFFKRRGIMAINLYSPLLKLQKEDFAMFKSTPSTCKTFSLISPNPHILLSSPAIGLTPFNTPENQSITPIPASLLQVKRRKSSNFRNSPITVTPNLSPIDFQNLSSGKCSISAVSINSSHNTMNSRIKLSFSSTSSTDESMSRVNLKKGAAKKFRSASYNVAVNNAPIIQKDEAPLDDDVFGNISTAAKNNNSHHEFIKLLRRNSLDSCISLFIKHEIDMDMFLTLSKADLAEIGVNWNKRDEVLEVIYQCNKMKNANRKHKN